MAAIRLPDDWAHRFLGFRVDGALERAWVHAAQGCVRQFGERALALFDVQRLLPRVLGIASSGSLRGPEWLESIPRAAWAIETAWGDFGGADYRPGGLWPATTDVRAVDEELGVLSFLRAHGYQPVERERRPGQPDWHVTNGEREMFVEVKSKGTPGEAQNLLHSAVVALQLLDDRSGLRSHFVNVNSPGNDEVVPRWAGDGRLDRAIEALFELRESLGEFCRTLRSDVAGPEVVIGSFAGIRVHLKAWGRKFRARLVEVASGSEHVELRFRPTDLERWVFVPHRTESAWVPRRLPQAGLEVAQARLQSLLLKSDPVRRGRQLRNAPDDTLFLIRWNAPFYWDDALADHPEDVDQVFSKLCVEAAEYREDAAIGLWTGSFRRVQRRIILNPAARELLGQPFLDDRRVWGRPDSS